MKNHRLFILFLLPLMIIVTLRSPAAFCEEQGDLCHEDHWNDITDDFSNDYQPLIIPFMSGNQITVAPIITCTALENGTFLPHYYPCKMAQTILVDNDWSGGGVNYTYIFEDWVDYDWNDIIVSLYASISNGISADLFLTFREACWKNPFSLEITSEGTWIKVEWNSTDYPDMRSSIVDDEETVEVPIFLESNAGDKAHVRFLVHPVANFSLYPVQPTVGEKVFFDASESYDPDKKIEIYSWMFESGASAQTPNATVTHVFNSPGTYSIKLTVIDNDGLTDTVLKSIKVLAVIGGKTTPLDNALIPTWRNINILLIAAFTAVAALMRGRKYSAT